MLFLLSFFKRVAKTSSFIDKIFKIYPALTVSNLSVPKAKRQVQDAHLKWKDENEYTKWAIN